MNAEHATSSKHDGETLERREDIERQWTQLLLDLGIVSGHAHTTMDEAYFADFVRMYGGDLFVRRQLPEALDEFMQEKFPKLDIKLSDVSGSIRNVYMVATVLLYHYITNATTTDNAIDIRLYLSPEQQILIRKFCENLKDAEVTVDNVDTAIAGAFENTPGMLERNKDFHDVADNQIVTTEKREDTWGSLNLSDSESTELSVCYPVDTIDTLFVKSPFVIKSSVIGYPGKMLSEAKNTTHMPMSATVDVDTTTDSEVQVVPKILKELEVEPIKLEASDLHLPCTKTCSKNNMIKIIDEPSQKPDVEITTPVNNAPKQNIDTLFFKSLFIDKSSAFGCVGSSEINKSKKDFNKTPAADADAKVSIPKTENKAPIKKIETLFLKSLFVIQSSAFRCPGNPKSSDLNPVSNNKHTCTDYEDKVKHDRIKNQDDQESLKEHEVAPKTKDPTETTKTLYFKLMSSIQSSVFEYTGKTWCSKKSVAMKPVYIRSKSKNTIKRRSNITSRNKFSNRKTEKKEQSQGIYASHLQKLDSQAGISMTGDPAKAIDTLYLKSPFSIKSSAFEHTGPSSSETKHFTNMTLLTTAACGMKSDFKETNFKLHTEKDVRMQTAVDQKASGKSLEPSNIKFTPDKINSAAENENKSKSYCISDQSLMKLDPIAEISGTSAKFPLNVKSYFDQIRSKAKIRNIMKNRFKGRKRVKKEKGKYERSQCNKKPASSEEYPLNVDHESKRPSSVLVVAHTESSKPPFTTAMMQPSGSTSRKKNISIQDSIDGIRQRRDSAFQTSYVEQKSKKTTGVKTDDEECSCPNRPNCKCKKDFGGNTEGSSDCASSSNSGPCKRRPKLTKMFGNMSTKKMWIILLIILAIIIIAVIIILAVIFGSSGAATRRSLPREDVPVKTHKLVAKEEKKNILINMNMNPGNKWFSWDCNNGLCQKVQVHLTGSYKSLSRCTLLCSGPQLWPHPLGRKHFGNKIVALARKQHSYKYVPSLAVHEHLAEAYDLFLRDLMRLEITASQEKQSLDLDMKDLHIEFNVENDPDPRMRLDTEESYMLTIETEDVVKVKIKSPSFCGVRHGLETLSQLMLLDQRTGYLITLEDAVIKDAPSYAYRGLMIDTARNFIPVTDLLRTIDAMAMCKLNTFHWRISDAASFPMVIPELPQLFEYGAYDREMVYKTEHIKLVVERAAFRGIRVLIEVAAPGPVGRAWSWTTDAYSPPRKEISRSTRDILCLRLKMHESVFDILETIYTFIIKLTQVRDIFHLSNGLFSFVNCYNLLEDRDGFLAKALVRLRIANNGTLPRLPLIWYNTTLMSRAGWTWHNFGIHLHDDNLPESVLNKYKLIQSSRWDLSCEMIKHRCIRYKTWQQMYNWRTWRDLYVMTIEGGEAVLWTDLVDKNNLDTHLWPRTAAVAERLWSDATANQTASTYEYLRLDAQRWRMLIRGVNSQTVWPLWCSFNPGECFHKIKT